MQSSQQPLFTRQAAMCLTKQLPRQRGAQFSSRGCPSEHFTEGSIRPIPRRGVRCYDWRGSYVASNLRPNLLLAVYYDLEYAGFRPRYFEVSPLLFGYETSADSKWGSAKALAMKYPEVPPSS